MSARVHTAFDASADTLDALCAVLREDRAAHVPPGSEQEIAWHAIVPAAFRQSPARRAVAGGEATQTATEPPIPAS